MNERTWSDQRFLHDYVELLMADGFSIQAAAVMGREAAKWLATEATR